MAPKDKKNFDKTRPKAPVTNDPRFASVHNDPRFLRPKKKDMKVPIDKRFASMMTSSDFSSAPRVDRYGRRIQQSTAEKELKRFYRLEEDDDEGEDETEEKSLEQLEKEIAEDEENLKDEESTDEEDEHIGIGLPSRQYDRMRGRGDFSSSDEDTDESDSEVEDEEENDDEIDHIQHIPEGEETNRLALVNMDWDKIKAVDIFKVLSTFKPDTGIIKKVTIYPSEFGKERLALEETQGPPKEIFKKKNESSSDSDDDDDEEEITEETIIKNQLEEGDGQDFDQEALRKYQLERLKYYYAVIECDSPQTAKVIYKSCDNTEYESSANFFDLRYIPDDMTFDDEPKDIATDAPEGYVPSQFTTDALQRTKVSLTWDEDDINRYQITRREFTQEDLKELDFSAYLASTDEEEDEDEDLDALREKYRKLLNGEGKEPSAYEDKIESDEEEGDMEITFTPGLSEAAGALVNNKEEQKEETTIETYLRKQKEKKKAKKAAKQALATTNKEEDSESELDEDTKNDPFFKEAMTEMEQEGFVNKKKKESKNSKKKRASKEEREAKARERAELELLMGDDGKSEGFDMKEILKREKLEKKKKGKKGKKAADTTEDDFEIDVNDPRFAAVQESHQFAIDPTNPQFKKTKNMQKLLSVRQEKMRESNKEKDEWKKEKKSNNDASTSTKENGKSNSSLQQLVASVKRKGALDNSKSGKRQKI
ncbi:uncharacterized protein BX663DRAFT_550295 [Cokeromyces recurvatus]|uniref:uncharacterized protein n=1 Tax=Cokeromyces recurvatus TaxID=90255 RepID=UPI0022211165|nr:uncharacterized protein BX663DRAFT_550295 [Cokeromyces recurvatus]KAI7904638.1 hypothetical protein BX663DRAFT_550295 [Cokeromyces recurvatus]